MPVQNIRLFPSLNPWRFTTLLIVGLLMLTGCFHDDDDGDDPGPALPSKITRISVDSNGVEANATSLFPSISETGRYVAFDTAADNLADDDTNADRDVFLHDVLEGKTTRVSVDSAGQQGDGESFSSYISPEGRYIAYNSDATNLVDADTNNQIDVFLYDTQTGETQRVSVDSAGVEADGRSSSASISDGGEFVVFSSRATNLVTGDSNGMIDVFLRHLQTGAVSRLSIAKNGAEGDGHSQGASISSNGQFVVFESNATNLMPGDTNNTNDIFFYDLSSNTIELVSIHTDGTQSDQGSGLSSINSDGSFVGFSTFGSTLVSDDNNGQSDVFLRDIKNGITTRASTNDAGEEVDGHSLDLSISGDGRYVVFASVATNLVLGDTNMMQDIFVKDLQTDEVARVSRSADGVEGNNNSDMPAFSSDGRFIVFRSDASNLVENDTNGVADIFIVPNPLTD